MDAANILKATALPVPQVIKMASCPTLSGTSELSYYIGKDEEDEILFFIADNTGGGYHNKEWVQYKVIKETLQAKEFGSGDLRPLFTGKSRNTPGFLLAVLVAEALAEPCVGKAHRYQALKDEAFLNNVQKLIAAGTDLTEQTGLTTPAAPSSAPTEANTKESPKRTPKR